MTSRTLFNIILKVIGILFIKDMLALLPSIFSVVYYFVEGRGLEDSVWILVLNLCILTIYCVVAYYFIFKTDLLIDKLKLDEGTHLETIPLNIHRSTVLSISIIVIGGLFLAEQIPNFFNQLITYYQNSQVANPSITDTGTSYMVWTVVKIIIGLLLIGNHRQIVNFIELKRKQ